ncbi:MAG: DUF1804 family protein [Neptuniibacter sp.]
MAYSDETKRELRGHFVHKGMSLKAASSACEVPYETARSWKRKAAADGDDWDTARAAARMSESGVKALTAEIIEDFCLLFQSTIEEIKKAEKISPLQKAESISRLSDAYTKTVKAAGASNPELSKLSVAMDVLKRQAEFIQQNYPDRKELFLEILAPFGEVLSREFS